jgi:hypothetical protein
MDMAMRKKILTVLVVPLIAALTAQAAASERLRNSNAYFAAPANSNEYFANQEALRAAHPITQGGTTGGTVNPGLTTDHMMHGYNG